MTISIVNFKKYLQKIKDDIENYKLNEAEIYLKLLKSKFNIPKRTEYYLNGKIATLKNIPCCYKNLFHHCQQHRSSLRSCCFMTGQRP